MTRNKVEGGLIGKFLSNTISYGFAPVGSVFDPDGPIHKAMDAARYAVWIQEARDAENYSRADEVREMAERFRCVVRQTKAGTHVLDGEREDIAKLHPVEVPAWGGRGEWVDPDKVCGRKVLEACYEMGTDNIVSYRVANWDQHPNFELAKSLGLPTALWSASGQSVTDYWWFCGQIAAIEAAIAERSIRLIVAQHEARQ